MTDVIELHGITFEWQEDYAWEATTRLPSWAGFQFGYLASRSDVSDGSVCITIEPRDIETNHTPSLTQSQAIKWLLDNEQKVAEVMWQHIVLAYPSQQLRYQDYLEDEFETLMPHLNPALSHRENLKPLIGLMGVVVHDVSKNNLPYLGFSLNCTWDKEHGLGFMLHGDRVVKYGGADTALLSWIADQDSKQ